MSQASPQPGAGLTQGARILRVLQTGRRVSAIDFLLPDVIDDRSPILRFSARISELRSAGHDIRPDGRDGRCRAYRLPRPQPLRATEPAMSPPDDDATSGLFDAPPTVPPPASAIGGEWELEP